MRPLLCFLVACAPTTSVPPEEMVRIPARDVDDLALDVFWVDGSAVPEPAFKRCIDAGVCSGTVSDGVDFGWSASATWRDAVEFCRWRGARLPTNLEIVRAESYLRVDNAPRVWTADIDPTRPDHRLLQGLQSVMFTRDQSGTTRAWRRWWDGLQPPPPGLDAASIPAADKNRFHCVRSSQPTLPVMGWAFVPARLSVIGRCRREMPCSAKKVGIGAFLLGRTEVTNTAYAACVADGACPESPFVFPREEPHVAALVQWGAAASYCRWSGGRLPSALEWEAAARQGDARLYPWGDESLRGCVDIADQRCGNRIVVGAGARDVTGDGVHGLAGVAAEWVEDGQVRGLGMDLIATTFPSEGSWYGFRCARDL
jgi:formylglycine-generating enzyme required for sulfatase activity